MEGSDILGLVIGVVGFIFAVLSLWLAWRWNRATEKAIVDFDASSMRLSSTIDTLRDEISALQVVTRGLDQIRSLMADAASMQTPQTAVLAMLGKARLNRLPASTLYEVLGGHFSLPAVRHALFDLRDRLMIVDFEDPLEPPTMVSLRSGG